MSTFRIGPFYFISLDGVPDVVGQKVEVVEHPGVDNVSIWRGGVRGRPFTCLSKVDAQNKLHARSLAFEYAELIGTGPHEMEWSSMLLAWEQAKVVVLDVRPVKVASLIGGVGGLNPPSFGWVECEWDLILVRV